MQGLASFCVFGEADDIYYPGAVRNAEMYLEHMPDVVCRYYLGKEPVRVGLHNRLLELPNTEIVEMRHPENQASTFWRFLALRDEGYDYFLSRDVDSRPIQRERDAVAEWLESDKLWHVMRDHPRHGAPMLAGLWGVKAEGARQCRRRIPDAIPGDHRFIDQEWLESRLWRYARWSLMAHCSVPNWHFKADIVVFPSEMTNEGFCGEGFKGDDTPRFPAHRLELMPDVLSSKPISIHP